MKVHKLVLIGLGHVGSAVLTQALAMNIAGEIACIDIKNDVAKGEALDAMHANACNYVPHTKVYAADFSACKDADLIICSGGPSILPGEHLDRLALAGRNIHVIGEIMTEVTKYTTDAPFIMITNPLDITTYLAATKFGYKKGRLFGTGTSLETFRFKHILGAHYQVDPKDIQGFILGEHGNSAFAAWSSISIGGVRFQDLDTYLQPQAPTDKEAIGKEVVKTAYDVLLGKGWTNSGIAMVACRIARAVLFDEKSILPVSVPFDGEYGIENVALSLPSIVGKDGVEKRLLIPLTEEEEVKLKFSADSVKEVMGKNNLF